jgi:tRNA A-37 threonylcarbamoyl transferase component Bud32
MEIFMPQKLTVNQTEYNLIKLLGKGKGGYSYLAEKDGEYYVLKQIHHEPCDYYTFGDKIEAELNDYKRLINTGINMPKMLDIDLKNERILKEYIDGETIFELVKQDKMSKSYFEQIRKMADCVKSFGLNIDYFPTNFVVSGGLIYYIDYECNEYSDEWNFENWGIKYWSKTKEFLEHIKTLKENKNG